MALEKLITDEKGIVSSYFRIVAIIEQYLTDIPEITVQLYGYADATYRDREKTGTGLSLANSFRQVRLAANDEKGYAREDIYLRLSTEIPEFSSSKAI